MKKKGKKGKGKSKGTKDVKPIEETLTKLSLEHRILTQKFYKKKTLDLSNMISRTKEQYKDAQKDYFDFSQELMDDIDIFKYRTQREAKVAEVAAVPKHKKEKVVVVKPKTAEELFDEEITKKAESDYKYVSEYTRLATLYDNNHPLRSMNLDQEPAGGNLLIFENATFGPRVETNRKLTNLMLRQELEIKVLNQNIQKLKASLKKRQVEIDKLKEYRDVESNQDYAKIQALRDKFEDLKVNNDRVKIRESGLHQTSVLRLKQKMDSTVQQIHRDSYQFALDTLNPEQLETYQTYKKLYKQAIVYETSLAKIKAKNDDLAKNNLEIARTLDRADWSIAYYNHLYKLWKEGKYEVPCADQSEPFFVSVIKAWENIQSENLVSTGHSMNMAQKTSHSAGAARSNAPRRSTRLTNSQSIVESESENSDPELNDSFSDNNVNEENNPFNARPQTPTKKAPKRQSKKKEEQEDDFELFSVVNAGAASLKSAASDWLELYLKEGGTAMTLMINLIIKASGSSNYMSSDGGSEINEQYTTHCTKHLKQMESTYTATSFSKAPLTEKKFKKNYSSLWNHVISLSGEKIIYDTNLIDELSDVLLGISGTWLDPLRLTATVTGLVIIDKLCEIGRKLQENVKKNVTEKIEIVEGFIAKLYDGLFVHRYKDIDHNVRVECVSHLSNWIDAYPMIFMDNTCLRYFGWLVSDKSSDVRLATVKGLLALCSKEDRLPGCRMLLERFKEPIMEISMYDQHDNVRIAGMDLLHFMISLGIVGVNEISRFEECLSLHYNNDKIKHRIINIIITFLKEQNEEENEEFLFKLLKLVNKNNYHLLVDKDNRKDVTFLFNYEKWINHLLQNEDMNEEDERNLLVFVYELVKSLASPEVTRFLISSVPKLLTKYATDPTLLRPTIRIIEAMDVKMYLELRQIRSYESLWDELISLFFKFNDHNLLTDIVYCAKNYLSVDDLGASVQVKQNEFSNRVTAENNLTRISIYLKHYYIEGIEAKQDFKDLMHEIKVNDPSFASKINIYSLITCWKFTAAYSKVEKDQDSVFEIYNLQQDTLGFVDEYIASNNSDLSSNYLVFQVLDTLYSFFTNTFDDEFSSLGLRELPSTRLTFMVNVGLNMFKFLKTSKKTLSNELPNLRSFEEFKGLSEELVASIGVLNCFSKLKKNAYITWPQIASVYAYYASVNNEYLDEIFKTTLELIKSSSESETMEFIEKSVIAAHEMETESLEFEHTLQVFKFLYNIVKGKLFTTDAMSRMHEKLIQYVFENIAVFQSKKDTKNRIYFINMFKVLKLSVGTLTPTECSSLLGFVKNQCSRSGVRPGETDKAAKDWEPYHSYIKQLEKQGHISRSETPNKKRKQKEQLDNIEKESPLKKTREDTEEDDVNEDGDKEVNEEAVDESDEEMAQAEDLFETPMSFQSSPKL